MEEEVEVVDNAKIIKYAALVARIKKLEKRVDEMEKRLNTIIKSLRRHV